MSDLPTFVQWIVFAFALLGAIATALKIRTLSTSRRKLHATITYGPTHTPDHVTQHLLQCQEFTDIGVGGLYSWKYYWRATVENKHGPAADSVKLFLPYAEIGKVFRAGHPPNFAPINQVVNLGTIDPGETIEVLAWTGAEPCLHHTHFIRLTHAHGRGDVTFVHGARDLPYSLSRT